MMGNATPDQSSAPVPERLEASHKQDPTWDRLEDQLQWYDRKSTSAQHAYRRLKFIEIVIAAAVPPLIGFGVVAAIPATLGAAVVVLEGIQQLYQFQSNWITYRSTAEALKHERYLYLGAAGPYADADRHRVLAETIEGLISQEHAKWTQSRREPADVTTKPGTSALSE
jgi:Protein of unknown function (DUF4231)